MNIAIIGGGFSGILTACYLLREDAHVLTILLFEKDLHQLSTGIAYRGSTEGQLLNVPAGRMSLQGMKPDDFYQWLRSTVNTEILPDDFVPRSLFGEYLKELFQKSVDHAKKVMVKIINDEVIDIIKEDKALHIRTSAQHTYYANKAVVANGILPSKDPFKVTLDVKHSGLYQANPWNFKYKDYLKNNDHIVLIGTGLTMLDHAIGLLKVDKNLKISVFSRRGLLPLDHASYKAYSFPEYNIIPHEDIGMLLKSIRTYYKKHRDQGLDWRNLIDRIRADVPKLWQALSTTSKARFIRHLKPYWEIHRHRAPAQILKVIYQAMQEKRFELFKGRLQSVENSGSAFKITIVNSEKTITLLVNYLLNSSGLQQDISLTSDPLLKNLMERGYMIADGNGLGVETDKIGAFSCIKGRKSIFTLGALRRASLLECTAAKEISEQAFQLSKILAIQ